MSKELMIFNNNKFGNIKIMYDSIGNAFFNLEDTCKILDLENVRKVYLDLEEDEKFAIPVKTDVTTNNTPIKGMKIKKDRFVTESGFYSLIFKSRKNEAIEFRKWVTSDVLPEIRRTGSFKLYGKEHQKKAMESLSKLLPELDKKTKMPYIKANTVSNKAVSNVYGFEKMIKKDAMTNDMLDLRQQVLDDYIKLFEITQDTTTIKTLLYAKYTPKLLS